MPDTLSGGDLVADVLAAHGVRLLFTLCGGHISPILVSSKRKGIRVVDVRDEVTAVFAADAVARLTGTPGVAAVTAGPGLTNTITAVKNAQMAQSPVILLGGATATMLKGRGALQDIDQRALLAPHVKEVLQATRVKDLAPMLARAFAVAKSGVPGPVFVECPVDLLYAEDIVRSWYAKATGGGGGIGPRLVAWYLTRHLDQLFADVGAPEPPRGVTPEPVPESAVAQAASLLALAERPLLVIGSGALLEPSRVEALASAVKALGVPVYLSGMARGLLGPSHPLQLRHYRKDALREADAVLLAGTPCDFRLDYGNHISKRARLIAVNRSRADLTKNRKPELAVCADPGLFLEGLARRAAVPARTVWMTTLRSRDDGRETDIAAAVPGEARAIDPLYLCREIERAAGPNALFVADGGDFVATASYVLRPRGPLAWLDPGVFGTLGVGAGFSLGAALCRENAEVWAIFGDGAAGFSLTEFDTFVRHGIPVIAVIGNDAGWTQIAREQVDILKDDVGTVLSPTDYHAVAAGFGAEGFLLDRPEDVPSTLAKARDAARAGRPVLVNALLGKTGFRKGSISI